MKRALKGILIGALCAPILGGVAITLTACGKNESFKEVALNTQKVVQKLKDSEEFTDEGTVNFKLRVNSTPYIYSINSLIPKYDESGASISLNIQQIEFLTDGA